MAHLLPHMGVSCRALPPRKCVHKPERKHARKWTILQDKPLPQPERATLCCRARKMDVATVDGTKSTLEEFEFCTVADSQVNWLISAWELDPLVIEWCQGKDNQYLFKIPADGKIVIAIRANPVYKILTLKWSHWTTGTVHRHAGLSNL